MQIHYVRSTGESMAPDDLLQCRMTIVGLDIDAIERDHSETFDNIKRNCMSCLLRTPCAVGLKLDPNNLVWEAYCPNSEALNALVALTEVIY